MSHTVTSLRLRGAALSLHKDGQQLYRKAFGRYSTNTVVALASATKWISGALILSLVDQGKIKLDDPVSKYLPKFTGTKGAITIRQCFSHTSGLPGRSLILSNRRLTLAQAVDRIATQVALLYAPGTAFHYGGVLMHVAGRVAEVAAGKDWEQLVRENLTGRMGLRTIDYQGLGVTKNYRVAGGARASLDDYTTFLRMCLHGAMHGSRRILPKAALAEMCKDQTGGEPIKYTPQPDARRYGIGIWRDRVDSAKNILQASSQGAFGFSPWIDFERNLVGVFLVANLLPRVASSVVTLQSWTRSNLDWAGVLCFGTSSPACRGEILATTNGIPGGGNATRELRSASAPPPLLLATTTDRVDDARMAVPLTGIASGTRFYSRFVWFNTPICTGPGRLSASSGLAVVVQ